MPREYVWLKCEVCGARNYRTPKETRSTSMRPCGAGSAARVTPLPIQSS